MPSTRTRLALLTVLLPLSACAQTGTPTATSATPGTAPQVLAQATAHPAPAVASGQRDGEFLRCLGGLRSRAAQNGLSGARFDALTAHLVPDMTVLPLLDRQPEFTTPIWDYMAGLVDAQRVAEGRTLLAQWRDVLDRVEQRYGVDPATVVAVWGVESNYGQTFGKRPLLTSLGTLACYGRRQKYFSGEFINALRIVDEGSIPAEQLVGSWAGAFGHTQFMPSTFLRIAVDFDGHGRRDLMNSVPDALASTANYLKQSNWRNNEPWGYEVRLPLGFDVSGAGRRNKQSVSNWAARGVTRIDGSALPASPSSAGLLLPAGANGPAFLVYRNFDAIYSYNAAESYALAIAHLADKLRGGGDFATPWPTDDPGLSRAERREVQERLLARGHAIGEPDGIIGSATRAAIEQEQARLGLPVDGRAGRRLLDTLRQTH